MCGNFISTIVLHLGLLDCHFVQVLTVQRWVKAVYRFRGKGFGVSNVCIPEAHKVFGQTLNNVVVLGIIHIINLDVHMTDRSWLDNWWKCYHHQQVNPSVRKHFVYRCEHVYWGHVYKVDSSGSIDQYLVGLSIFYLQVTLMPRIHIGIINTVSLLMQQNTLCSKYLHCR